MMSREANLPRKAMRVSIPLFVEIGGRSHVARDWSTTGVGLGDLDALPAQGEVLAARVSFPLQESTLVVPVRMVFRGVHEGVAGFEFQDLSPRNRKLLRHYIELSLEGKLGDVQDIVAAAALPGAAHAAQAPLTLGSGGMPALQPSPRHGRLLGSVVAGLAVLAAGAGIVWYNLTYQLEGTGFVGGSIARVTANNVGQIGKLLVEPGTRVEPGTPLFTVENPTLRDEITALEQQVGELARQQTRLTSVRRQAEAGVLQTLRRDWSEREAELATARRLLAAGAITQRELMLVANQVQDLRVNYMRQVAEGATHVQTLDNSDTIAKLRLDLASKKVLLARQEADRTVRAPVRGKVFTVDRLPGEFVTANQPVVLLEADVTPSVFLRVPNDDAVKLKLGMPAQIYVASDDRKYSAKVSGVGLNAASATAAVTQEGGLNETLVKLDFDDRKVRLPVNSRVNVWIRNPALPWS
ncbi:HlyD family efflux transporter periplasmic adaptor subunit [Ramlibacter alkalitolerans]|uniref:HlyD family efflux transporter periplasmic adaptor subunit n=1 Tax=Ramlibacter alkalitolerans TaxID=2039631 RepID=A0ABS1JVA7_9BURK|nr:HlyD family efflux transporter periplasmic adaptor subunit [Ramlibacter alkalitolerans]MBL0428144.1 HlyD family efflux transporter periplasmic adaptor subunit [Ramlibacter alkalitolerans]